ncbi:hypothetical protein BV25DRAFT_1775755, partial [Artomyces pyxidatus]
LRREQMIPVFIGRSLPRGDRSPEESVALKRALLILFKPWRSLADLKENGENWASAYDRHIFPTYAKQIISNIHVEHECKDARDRIEMQRR